MLKDCETRLMLSEFAKPLQDFSNGVAYAIYDKRYKRVLSIQSRPAWRESLLKRMNANNDPYFKSFTSTLTDYVFTPETASSITDPLEIIELEKRIENWTQFPCIFVQNFTKNLSSVFTIYSKEYCCDKIKTDYSKEIRLASEEIKNKIHPMLFQRNSQINISMSDKLEQQNKFFQSKLGPLCIDSVFLDRKELEEKKNQISLEVF